MLKRFDSVEKETQRLAVLERYLVDCFRTLPHPEKMLPQTARYMDGIRLIWSEHPCTLPNKAGGFAGIEAGSRIAIFSAGSFGQRLYARCAANEEYRLTGWFDKDYEQYQKEGLPVMPPEEVSTAEFDRIMIASLDGRYIALAAEFLRKNGISHEKIAAVRFERIES